LYLSHIFFANPSAELNELQNDLTIPIVIFGNGTATMARKFREDNPFRGELYIDEKLKAYNAFNLPNCKISEISV
jgi:hypothetical protein